MRKGLWSPDEDEKLKSCIAHHKNGSWSDIARKAGLQRCGKSCRRRWMNHLRPDLKREKFTPEELKLVAKLHQTMGNKWSEIATYLVGRTDNDVKNLWNTQIKRQLKIDHNEPSLETKGNEHHGFPFSMDSNLDQMGQLSFGNSQSSIKPIFPTNSCLIVDSCGSSSINPPEFDAQIEPQGILKEKHNVMNMPFNPFITSTSQEGTHTQKLSQHIKLEEERFDFFLDECHLMDSIDACTRAIKHTTQIHSNDGIHNSYNASIDYSGLLVESIAKKKLDGNISSSYSSWEGARSSNESSTGTITIGDDTCSVGKPPLFELHHQALRSQQGDDNNYNGQDQKDDVDAIICLSRRESWSSSPCEQWTLETLIGTCDGYSKVAWY